MFSHSPDFDLNSSVSTRDASEEGQQDKIDEALAKVHGKVQEATDDIKQSVGKKADELWKIFQEKYLTKHMKDAFDMCTNILGSNDACNVR